MIDLVAEVKNVNKFLGLSLRNFLNVILKKKKNLCFDSTILKTKSNRKLVKYVNLELLDNEGLGKMMRYEVIIS